MATANSDAAKELTLQLKLDQGALRNACVPEATIQALISAKLVAVLPASESESGGVSPLQNNIATLDSSGRIYVPGVVIVPIQEQTVTIGVTVAPGQPVTVVVPVQGISDLASAFKALDITVSPPESAVYQSPVITENNTLRITFYRVDIGGSPPYPVITIQVRGKVYEFPQSQTIDV